MIGATLNLANITITATYRNLTITGIRDCSYALRDLIALNGTLIGWTYDTTATDANTTGGINGFATFKNTEIGSPEWLGVRSITYTASNAAAPLCVSSAMYQSSVNSGGAWSDVNDSGGLNILTCTYDANGDLDSTTWS